MVKILTAFLFLILAGCCSTDKVVLTTKTIPVAVPLIYSPAPPVVPRPDLPHLSLSAADQKVDGKVVLAYAASIEALIGYSEQLEQIIANYNDINAAYATLRTNTIATWKTNTGVDITIPDPTVPATSTPAPTKPVVPPTGDLVTKP